jgi:DHA1 family multidrug resistance protein-like MFS transporter
MTDLFRDTIAGKIARIVSKGKLLPHHEEKDPSIWKKYVNHEKSARVAHHGHPGEEKQEEENQTPASPGSDDSSRTRQGDVERNALGHKIDPEKGRDVNIVHFEENDPEVSF